MPKMTPEHEAAFALGFKVAQSGLGPAAQVEYDRLIEDVENKVAACDPQPLSEGHSGR